MKKSQLTKISIRALIGAAFLTIPLLFFYVHRQKAVSFKSPPASPLAADYTPSPNTFLHAVISDSQNWKSFKSEDLGFEFSYPPEYSLTQKDIKVFLQKEDSGGLLYLKVVDNQENLSARQWFDNQCPCKTEPLLETHTLLETNTNGFQVVKLSQKEPAKYHDIKIIASGNRKIFFFNFSPETEKAYLADQIFATFKLLD